MSVVIALPVVAYSQGGTADADLPGIAMLLATIAFLSCAGFEGPGIRLLVPAAASAGVLLGIKVTYLPVVFALVVVVLITVPIARRRAYVLTGMTTLFVTGSFWYLRNLARTGSPLPSAPLRVAGLGFTRIADAASDCGTRSVAAYATNVSVWRSSFAPMLRLWFGPLWWLVGLGAGLALIAVLVRPSHALSRTLAITGIVAAISYAVTPATAGGPVGDPVCFGYNTRLLLPALTLGAVALGVAIGTVVALRSAKGYWAVVVALFAVMLITLWSSMRLTPGLGRGGYVLSVVLIGVAVLAAVFFYGMRQRPVRREAAAVVLVAAVAAAGWIPARVWRSQRTTTTELAFLGSLPTWADRSPKLRIAIVGFSEQWPLYGSRLQNRVGLPAVESQRGALRSPTDCDGWRRALRAGRFDHVVVLSSDGSDVRPVLRWIAADSAAERIDVPGTVASVFRFDPTTPSPPCNGS